MADHFNLSIRVFDTSGRQLREFGRRGSGPGEFQGLAGIAVTDSTVLVIDPALQRTTTFTADGRVKDAAAFQVVDQARRLAFTARLPLRHGFSIAHGSTVLGSHIPAAGPDMADHFFLAGPRGIVDTLGVFRSGSVAYRYAPWGNVLNFAPGFSLPPAGTVAVGGDSLIAVVDGVRGTIRVSRVTTTGHTDAGITNLGWSPEPLPRSRVSAVILDRLLPLRAGSKAADFTLLLPEYIACVHSALLDSRGRVWLKQAAIDHVFDARPRPERWIVTQTGLGKVAVVDLPIGFQLKQVTGNRLVGIHVNELDEQTVRVYLLPAAG